MNFSQNAKFALVIGETPKEGSPRTGPDPDKQWRDFLFNLRQHSMPLEGMQVIHDNVWLIPLDNGMPFLQKLFEWGSGTGIPLRILFLDEAPDWLQYPKPFAAKPSQPTS